ncbi:LLM class flavin-dependent oxidoreductase [Micromonospora sp. NPDC049751]|uniref:LLM class flavin-dependent oxidoreductase n=1 Tax=Micromonospora sp. NPDC049751 TaxID=3154837 RepID=UPI0033E4057C
MVDVGVALNMYRLETGSDAAAIRGHLALAELAQRLGFHSAYVYEHHFSGYLLSPSPMLLLGHLAGRAPALWLGASVIVLPWHHPVRVAEEIALLDNLTGGRCRYGFGKGIPGPEHQGFGVPEDELDDRFAEALAVVHGCLTHEIFQFRGTYVHVGPVGIRPRPQHRPHERFYLAGTAPAPRGLESLEAGRLVHLTGDISALGRRLTAHQTHRSDLGLPPASPIVFAPIFFGSDASAARSLAAADLRMRDTHLAPAATAAEPSADRVRAALDTMIVGDADEVTDRISRIVEHTAAAEVVLEFAVGGAPLAEVAERMTRFAHAVLPRLTSVNGPGGEDMIS